MITQQDIEAVIQSGEGYTIEFKRSVNTDLSKEMVAFANSSGGRIFIGIEDDGGITGVNITNDLRSKVQGMAHDCDPAIKIELEVVNDVLVVHVSEGKNKPYRCTNGFYVRSGPNSEKLTTEGVRDFFKEQGKIHFDEMPFPQVTYVSDLDEYAIKKFMSLLNLDSPILPDHLFTNIGLLNGNTLNHAGVLFFAKYPSRYIPQSVVTCVVYKGNNKVDIIDKKSFEFHLIENIDESIAFLKRHLNVAYEIKGKRRTEKLEIPEVVLREAVVNAVAHRDYFEKGATVMIEIFDNRVEITNPGGLPKGLNAKDFGTRTLARNPLIASLLNRVGYIEKLGTGIQRIRQEMERGLLPAPVFHFDGFFSVVLFRHNFVLVLKKELSLNDKRSQRIAFILRALATGEFNVEEAATSLDTSARTVRNDLDLLTEKGWVKVSGATKGRDYELTEIGTQKLSSYG